MTASIPPNVSKPSRDFITAFRSDSFGRTKISEPFTVFESTHIYQKSEDFSEYTSGTASVTYLPNESGVSLGIGSASGDIATMESFRVMPFQTGKSLQIMQTFSFSTPRTNLRERAGYFSRENGYFLERVGNDVFIVQRSSVTGSVVDTRIPQSNWNIDALDGNGPSDVVLDLSKSQMMWIEMTSSRVGSVRIGFQLDGYFITAHEIHAGNRSVTPNTRTASLPIRYEIENIAATSGSSSMKQYAVAVISNGGIVRQVQETVVTTNGVKTVGTEFTPLIAFRLAPGRTDAVVLAAGINIYPTTNDDFEWILSKNPQSLTGGTWTTVGPKNNVQVNITATAMVDGYRMHEGFFGATNQNQIPQGEQIQNYFAYQLGRTNAVPAVSDVFVLACRTLDTSGQVKAALSWQDLI